MDASFGSWGTQTFIPGLSADALIAPWVIKGAMDDEAFAAGRLTEEADAALIEQSGSYYSLEA